MMFLYLLLGIYLFWLLFLSVMALNWRWHLLSKPVKALALPAVLVAVVIDVIFNTTIGSVLFLERPHQWTFSRRVGEYKRRGDWRTPLAKWICTNLLDPFEVGGHCL